MTALTREQANAVYDVLVEHAGASEADRADFALYVSCGVTEYRFQGGLGFGGKFWTSGGRWYVTCYREDLTADRQRAIDVTNAALAGLRAAGEGQAIVTDYRDDAAVDACNTAMLDAALSPPIDRYVILHTDPSGLESTLAVVVYDDVAAAQKRVDERRRTAAELGWTDRYEVFRLVPVEGS